jgi:hypothetical protein
MLVAGFTTQFARPTPLACSNPVFGSRPPIRTSDRTPRNRVTAACESMPPPGRRLPTRRPLNVPVAPIPSPR